MLASGAFGYPRSIANQQQQQQQQQQDVWHQQRQRHMVHKANKAPRKRPKFIRKVLCQVCEDVANDHVHYGAIVCYSCRAFFRRGVTNNAPFYCSQDQRCPIDKTTRKHCQYCRFQKCVGVGMKADWVMTEDDKREKKEKSIQRKMLTPVVEKLEAVAVVPEVSLLKTSYEERMRQERAMKRASKRPHHSKRPRTSSCEEERMSSCSDSMSVNLLSPPPMEAIINSRGDAISPTSPDPTPPEGNPPPAGMASASTAAVLFDFSQPMTVESGYQSGFSPASIRSPDCNMSDSDDDIIVLDPTKNNNTAKELLPTAVCSNNMANMFAREHTEVIDIDMDEDPDIANHPGDSFADHNSLVHSSGSSRSNYPANIQTNFVKQPDMCLTIEERSFLQNLLKMELDTSKSIPVPSQTMSKIIQAARSGTVIPYDAAVEGYTVCLERVIKFASQLDLFMRFSVKDQFSLLLKNVDMVVNIRTARFLRPGINLRDQLSHAIGWKDRGMKQLVTSYKQPEPNPSASTSSSSTAPPLPQQQVNPNGEKRLELTQIFQSPWASDFEYEQNYAAMMKSIFDLNMDHNTTTLLTMMALFTVSQPDMDDPNEASQLQENFSRLLYRYLTAEVGRVNAVNLLPHYTKILSHLEHMADILASKRLML